MPDIMKDFAHLSEHTQDQLFARRQELVTSAPDTNQLSDEALIELLAIARILRTRTSAPAAKTSKRATAPTLDAL